MGRGATSVVPSTGGGGAFSASSCSEPPSRVRGSGDEGAVPAYADAKKQVNMDYRGSKIVPTFTQRSFIHHQGLCCPEKYWLIDIF